MNQQALTMTYAMFPIDDASAPQGLLSQDFRFNFHVFSAMRQALRAHSQAMPITVLGRADFIHHITLHMPEVSLRIEEEDFGILHLEMGAMKLATRDAIVRYELHTVNRHFSFIAYLFEHADNALHDAIQVSYVEALFIGEASPEYANARSLLPKNLVEALKKGELRFKLLDLQIIKY